VVRHRLVKAIIRAYDSEKQKEEEQDAQQGKSTPGIQKLALILYRKNEHGIRAGIKIKKGTCH
jgi:hypothetical protein